MKPFLKNNKTMKKQQKGLTILELLIASVLGLIIISGVVRLVARTMDSERLMSNNADMNEVLTYVNSRLNFVFKEALSSPCGSLDNMIHNGNLRRAKTTTGGVQEIPNIIKNTGEAVIKYEDFPMLAVGIQGSPHEPKDYHGQPMSTLMPGIVPESEYIIVMETSEKIVPKDAIMSSVKNITGSVKNDDNAVTEIIGGKAIIHTTNIATRVNKSYPPTFIITNCTNADIFNPHQEFKQEKNKITLPANLYFSVEYKPSETLFAPIEMYAYYISKVATEDSPRFTRVNLTAFDKNRKPTAEVLVSSIESIKYDWGLGDIQSASVQAYFPTKELIGSITSTNFRDNLISVRATITARGTTYKTATDEDGKIKEDGILRTEAQHIYTIRNKMSRI